MIINWYGEACFKIQSGETVILTDPVDAASGLSAPRFRADVTIRTLTPFPIPSGAEPEGRVVSGSGEYEVQGIEIWGGELMAESTREAMKTVYLVQVEDVRLALLGHLAEIPDADTLERLGDVDVLFIPAGGAPHLGCEKAVKLIRQLNPKIVVASLFRIPKLTRKAGDVKEFLKELEERAEPQEKLLVKKKDLPAKLQVAVLSA